MSVYLCLPTLYLIVIFIDTFLVYLWSYLFFGLYLLQEIHWIENDILNFVFP